MIARAYVDAGSLSVDPGISLVLPGGRTIVVKGEPGAYMCLLIRGAPVDGSVNVLEVDVALVADDNGVRLELPDGFRLVADMLPYLERTTVDEIRGRPRLEVVR